MLKDCYSPFNPDADTRLNCDYSAQDKKALQIKLVEGLATILNAANFQKITETDQAKGNIERLQEEYLRHHGFGMPEVNYNQDVEPDIF